MPLIANELIISKEELLSLIDVTEPYFALENFSVDHDGNLTATIKAEQLLFFEPLPISSSETGRHLAVLGSCACALFNPKKSKHFYLAASANATRMDMNFTRDCPSHFIGRAKCIKVDSRNAQAKTFLEYPDGTVFSEIVINYHVLEHGIFERIYKDKLVDLPKPLNNPYIFEPQVPYNFISDKQLFAVVDPVNTDDCAGHFPNLPVVPISILFRILVKLGIILMQERLNRPDAIFCVRECTTEAKNFAYPGEEIDINTRFIHTDEKDQHFVKVAAYTHCDCCVGATEMILIEVK